MIIRGRRWEGGPQAPRCMYKPGATAPTSGELIGAIGSHFVPDTHVLSKHRGLLHQRVRATAPPTCAGNCSTNMCMQLLHQCVGASSPPTCVGNCSTSVHAHLLHQRVRATAPLGHPVLGTVQTQWGSAPAQPHPCSAPALLSPSPNMSRGPCPNM